MMRRAATLLSMLSMLKCVDSMRIVRPAISRRPFFAAATAAALAASPVAAQGGLSAGALAQAGMEAFRENRVAESIELFDAAEARNPKYRTRLWQRGLSYYYAGNFAAAAEQFKIDVADNPNDTEESIWHLLSRAQLDGLAAARANMIVVGKDPRPVMRAVEKMFRSGDAAAREDVERIAASGGTGDRAEAVSSQCLHVRVKNLDPRRLLRRPLPRPPRRGHRRPGRVKVLDLQGRRQQGPRRDRRLHVRPRQGPRSPAHRRQAGALRCSEMRRARGTRPPTSKPLLDAD